MLAYKVVVTEETSRAFRTNLSTHELEPLKADVSHGFGKDKDQMAVLICGKIDSKPISSWIESGSHAKELPLLHPSQRACMPEVLLLNSGILSNVSTSANEQVVGQWS